MRKNKKNNSRNIELSVKLAKMGDALVNEGISSKNISIAQSGNVMLLISSIIIDEEQMEKFCELCSMYVAKTHWRASLIDNMFDNPFREKLDDNHPIA
jgi:hypothetical protein